MNLDEEPEEKCEDFDKDKVLLPYEDKEYMSRIPSKNYYQYKILEQLALNAPSYNSLLKVYVICPGFLYGCGEGLFYDYFKVSL